MSNRVWVDVEDLFQYAAANARPSGIQRVVFELCRALAALPDAADRIGFLRHDPVQDGFVAIPFEQIDAVHRRLTQAPGRVAAAPATVRDASADGAASPGAMRRLAYRMPLEVRAPAVALAKAQIEVARAAVRLAGAVGRQVGKSAGEVVLRRAGGRDGSEERNPAPPPPCFALSAAPGDVLLVLGSTWFHPFYASMLGRACTRHGLRSAVLFYDAIPLIRPEWCERNLAARFRHWAETLLPITDIPLSISRATGCDLERFAAGAGIALRGTPRTIPMGTGFSRPAGMPDRGKPGHDMMPGHAAGPGRDATPEGGRLPPAGSYVLIVSTVEARKNHLLLFRVWRRLLDDMPRHAVPTLVFAGRIGWLVEDLMQQLRNTDWLGGSIVPVDDPSDDELEQLYRGCLFTVFPSFYEGWGLPVTESLGLGRPCVASSSSALPEAGGTLARYFDPEDGNAAYLEIRRAIEDRDGTEAWAAQVRQQFRPVGWDETVRALMAALDEAA